MANSESTLAEHLEFLYGADAGPALDDLQRLMRSFAERISARSPRPLTEKDAVLITYGDMVSEIDETPLASLGEFLEDQVSDVMGTVHILPFYPYSSDDGFSVIDYLEVDPTLGDWEDVSRIGKTFRLMFDAVLNHISAESTWFERFRDCDEEYEDYFTVMSPDADTASVFRPRELPLLTAVDTAAGERHVWTTFSADQIDLNYRNPAVLLAALRVILTYVERGADVIRLDAIAFIWKELGTSCIHLPQTHRIIQLFRSVLDVVAPDVVLITETNVPHLENVSYFGDGTNEAHLVYNFALPPLTLHAFHTGDATVLSRWAAAMEAPSRNTTFFNFLASHDGVGVGGARGYLTEEEIGGLARRTEEVGGNVSYRVAPDGTRIPYELNINYLDALAELSTDEPDDLVVTRFLTSQAVMLALQGMPGIYFHSLFGSRGWTDGVAETGVFRTVNRQRLSRKLLESELSTAGSLRHQVFQGYRHLLSQRAAHRPFAPDADQHTIHTHQSVFALLRITRGGGEFALCLHNVSPKRCDVPIDLADTPLQEPLDMVDLVGGESFRLENGALSRAIGPYQTLWLIGQGDDR